MMQVKIIKIDIKKSNFIFNWLIKHFYLVIADKVMNYLFVKYIHTLNDQGKYVYIWETGNNMR